jgi:dephospho-CoA kinase
MKLLITGYKQHGKDTVCSLIQQIYGLTSISSSYYAVMHTDIFDDLALHLGVSKSLLYKIRDDYRKEFFDLIRNANIKHGMDFLGQGIFANYDIYNGIRNHEEFFAIKEKKLFDTSIWVDASERKPAESIESCTMRPEYCDIILDNNGNMEELVLNIICLLRKLQRQTKGSQ